MKKYIRTIITSLSAGLLTLTAIPLPTSAVSVPKKADSWDGTADTSWYDSKADSFSIDSAEALAGLAELVNAGDPMTGKSFYPHPCGGEDLDSKTFTILFEYDGIECSKMNLRMSLIRKAVQKGLDPITLADCKRAFNNVDFAAVINMVVGIAETGQTGVLFECSDGKAKAKFIVE